MLPFVTMESLREVWALCSPNLPYHVQTEKITCYIWDTWYLGSSPVSLLHTPSRRLIWFLEQPEMLAVLLHHESGWLRGTQQLAPDKARWVNSCPPQSVCETSEITPKLLSAAISNTAVHSSYNSGPKPWTTALISEASRRWRMPDKS